MECRLSFSFLITLFVLIQIPQLNCQVFFTESFNRGIPASWTAITLEGDGTWNYTNTAPQGGKFPDLKSPSSRNGWAVFDSDLHCDFVPQDAWLVSPQVSGLDRERIFLVFETLYRKFDDKVFIRVGSNVADLENWETIEIFEDLANNEYSHRNAFPDELHNPHNMVVDLTPYAAGQSNFRFAFQFLSDKSTEKFGLSGCAFFWQIDDIRLTELTNELVMDSVRLAPNYATPLSQVSEVNFAGVVQNNGLIDQNDIRVKATVSDNRGIITEVTSNPVSTLAVGETQIVGLNTGFTPTAVDTFYLDYTVEQSESDDNPSTNVFRTKFRVTENIFAKDNGLIKSLTAPGVVNGEFWEVGHYFFVPNGGDIATQIAFAAGSSPNPDGSYPHFGQTVNAFLYKIEEDDNDEIFNDNEAKIVGFGTFTYTEERFNELIQIDLFSLESDDIGVPLEAGGQYMAMIELPKFMGISYTELSYYYDPATIVKNGRWFLAGFGPDITPIVRLILGTTTSQKRELADYQLSMYPNPASNEINIDYDLEAITSKIRFSIIDAGGRLIESKHIEQAQKGSLTWAVEDLPIGAYILRLTTEEGFKSMPFTIQR